MAQRLDARSFQNIWSQHQLHSYSLISGANAEHVHIHRHAKLVDVRDIAKAHGVLSFQLSLPCLGRTYSSSFLATYSPGSTQPGLKSRIINYGEEEAPELLCASLYAAEPKELLVMAEYIGWKSRSRKVWTVFSYMLFIQYCVKDMPEFQPQRDVVESLSICSGIRLPFRSN
jgi:hypothetical protein